MPLSKKLQAHRGGARANSKRSGCCSRVGNDLVEGFEEIARHLRGEIELEAQELHLLRSPTNAKRLRAAIRKADAGKLIEHDIESIGLSRVRKAPRSNSK
jgi:hypothetical protein